MSNNFLDPWFFNKIKSQDTVEEEQKKYYIFSGFG